MDVRAEKRNRFDPNAMVVEMPSLDDIPIHFIKDVTKVGNKDDKKQTVESIAGKTIGRVPANLCKLFKGFSEKKFEIYCRATGDPTLSASPPAQRSFKKNKSGKDCEGGGAVIPCIYSINVPNSNFLNVKSELVDFFGLDCDKVNGNKEVYSCPW